MTVPNRKILATPIKDFQLGNDLDSFRRAGSLTREAIKDILQTGPVQFVVADVGHELEIVDTERCVKFWREEVEKHLAEASKKCSLEEFPDEYMYFASKWLAKGSSPIILLEKQH
jgi:hypothetical protein